MQSITYAAFIFYFSDKEAIYLANRLAKDLSALALATRRILRRILLAMISILSVEGLPQKDPTNKTEHRLLTASNHTS